MNDEWRDTVVHHSLSSMKRMKQMDEADQEAVVHKAGPRKHNIIELLNCFVLIVNAQMVSQPCIVAKLSSSGTLELSHTHMLNIKRYLRN